MYFHLSPLDLNETKEYVRYRLKVASEAPSDRIFFTDEALECVYQFSKGVPRLINQICDFALLTAYVDEKQVIDATVMKEVIGESPMKLLVNEKEKQTIEENL